MSDRDDASVANLHPFEKRNIAGALPSDVRALFDNGHYSQATFEAFKFVDSEVRRHAGINESGFKLMMAAFGPKSPRLRLTAMSNDSELSEQDGFKFLFAGAAQAIRNPRGHEYSVRDGPDLCLDHLTLASMLLRRLATAGYS